MLDLDPCSWPILSHSRATASFGSIAWIRLLLRLCISNTQISLCRNTDNLCTSILFSQMIHQVTNGSLQRTNKLGLRRLFRTGTKAFGRPTFQPCMIVRAWSTQYLTDGAFGLSTIASTLLGAAGLASFCNSSGWFRVYVAGVCLRCVGRCSLRVQCWRARRS